MSTDLASLSSIEVPTGLLIGRECDGKEVQTGQQHIVSRIYEQQRRRAISEETTSEGSASSTGTRKSKASPVAGANRGARQLPETR